MKRPSLFRLTGFQRPLTGALLSGFAGQAILVVSGVVAARALGPTDRGYFAMFALIAAVIGQLGSLGLPDSLAYHLSKHPQCSREIAHSTLRFAALLSLLLLSVQSIVLFCIFEQDSEVARGAAPLTLVLIPAALAQRFGLAILQGRKKFAAFNVMCLLPALVYSVFISIVWLSSNADLYRVTLVYSVANLLTGAAVLSFAVHQLRDSSRYVGEPIPSIKKIVSFGARGLLGSSSPVEKFNLDQAVIGLFLSPTSLGLYVVAQSFTNLPRFATRSVGNVAYPYVASAPDQREARKVATKFLIVATLLSATLVIMLELATGILLPFFFGSEFSEAISITRILLIGAFFTSVRRVSSDCIRALGHPGANSLAEVASWIWLFPTLLVLLPRFDLIGVAIALTSSSLVGLLVLILVYKWRTAESADPNTSVRESTSHA